MDPERPNLDEWLMRKVAWMVEETSPYLDTRELLSLCQTVALIRLNQTLQKLDAGQELDGIRRALDAQSAALTGLISQRQQQENKTDK
jgi:hypothetical protein